MRQAMQALRTAIALKGATKVTAESTIVMTLMTSTYLGKVRQTCTSLGASTIALGLVELVLYKPYHMEIQLLILGKHSRTAKA